MTSMRNIASVAIVSWRQEDSTLSQRLGELRNSKGDQGITTEKLLTIAVKVKTRAPPCHFMEPGWVTEDIILILF